MNLKTVKSNNPLKSVIQTINVKAHGGELKVNTEENVGKEFSIQLPFNNQHNA